MNTATKILSLTALCCAMAAPTGAQQTAAPDAPAADVKPTAPAGKPSKQSAQSEAGDPRADTSSSAMTDPAAPAAAPPADPGRAPAAARAAREPKSGAKSPPKIDRLELGTATVTGDREQPKVMYIVPWKRSDIGDLAGKPMNSLVDEILAPVDRDVFKREVVYYHAVQADASQNGASRQPSQQGEK
jgi:hypothetical protein